MGLASNRGLSYAFVMLAVVVTVVSVFPLSVAFVAIESAGTWFELASLAICHLIFSIMVCQPSIMV